MRPRNHQPLSVSAMKWAPSGATRMAEMPPKCSEDERSTRPPRNSSSPNCRREGSRTSKAVIGSLRTSIATGGGADGDTCASPEMTAKSSALAMSAVMVRRFVHVRPQRRRVVRSLTRRASAAAGVLGIDDGDGAAVVACDVVTDADRDQLHRRAGLDILDHPAQVPLQIVAGIDRQRGIVD